MKPLSPTFYSNDFNTPLPLPGVRTAVTALRWSAIGGCESAGLAATGDALTLMDLANRLRAPVVIYDSRAQPCWWGYLQSVRVCLGGVEVQISLESMANRVAVVYAELAAGTTGSGRRAETAWAEDAASIAAYGVKEHRAAQTDASAESAAAFRDALFAAVKTPRALCRQLKLLQPIRAHLVCRGWWETLGWRYYAAGVDALELNDGTPDAWPHLGDTSESPIKGALAQRFQFTLGSEMKISRIGLIVFKTASPMPSPLTLALCADNGGAVGAVLASVAVAGGDTASGEWVERDISPVSATDGAWYWIQASVAATGAQYYMPAARTGGACKVRDFNTGAWSDLSPAAGLRARLGVQRENAQEVRTAILATGQFITGVDLENASGLSSSQYKSGDETTRHVVEELLRSGTTNGRRLLAEVTLHRRVRVYEEPGRPARGGAALSLDGAGRIYDPYGAAWPLTQDPTGRWCFISDRALPALDLTRLADPGAFFIERATYDATGDRLELCG